jgi:hypothetical protein
MIKRIRAEYDEASGSLVLIDPLEGIENREKVMIAVEGTIGPKADWRALRDSLPAEAAEDLRRVLVAARADEE